MSSSVSKKRRIEIEDTAVPTMDTVHEEPSKRRRIEEMIAKNYLDILAAEEKAKQHRERQYELRADLNTTTSVFKLPREILEMIFLTAPLTSVCNAAALPERYILGGVCKAWRTIVQSIPRLRSHISILLDEERIDMQISLIETCLQRSGNLPLGISILVDDQSKWEPPVKFFEMIVRCCDRWEYFYCPALQGLSLALKNGTALSFPLLERMQIRRHPTKTLNLKKWKFHFPSRLTSLDVLDSVSQVRKLEINWSNLTSLTARIVLGPNGHRPEYNDCIPLELLGTCESLVDLHCKLRTTPDPTPGVPFQPESGIITLPCLKFLIIYGVTPNVTKFMSMTKLPALRDLDIQTFRPNDSTDPEDPSWTTGLVEWAQRSHFRLENLDMWTDNLIDDHPITDMLKKLSPSHPIQSLTIGGPSLILSDSLIHRLTMKLSLTRRNRARFLPHLSFFHCFGEVSFRVSSLITMLKSRMKYAAAQQTRNSNLRPLGNPLPEIIIRYRNRDWFRDQDPNRMFDLYETIETYKRTSNQKLTFDILRWDGGSDQDLE